jgi:ArsR family transcriptional regulator
MMASSSPKQAVFAALAEVARALASPNRVEMVELLGQGERSVEGVAARLGLGVANASQHLRQMRAAGVLASRRQGKQVMYRLADPAVIEVMTALGRLGERNVAAVQATLHGYFNARDGMEAVSRADLAARLADGLVTVLDVRPEDEFAAGRVPGAINIPLRDLVERLGELPADRTVIAYCRGPYCVLSFEAVALLRERGFDARRLEDGYPEWVAAGLAVDRAA